MELSVGAVREVELKNELYVAFMSEMERGGVLPCSDQ